MRRIKTDLWAVGLAVAIMALFADRANSEESKNSNILTLSSARAEGALYLDGPVSDARIHRAAQRWAVTDGHTTAWLDARTGALVEVGFDARPSGPDHPGPR